MTQTATERLYLTADGQRLVGEGHKDAATLYAALGDEIPDEAAARFGLTGGALGSKARKGAEDKQLGGGEDKAAGAKPKPGLTIHKRVRGK